MTSGVEREMEVAEVREEGEGVREGGEEKEEEEREEGEGVREGGEEREEEERGEGVETVEEVTVRGSQASDTGPTTDVRSCRHTSEDKVVCVCVSCRYHRD